MPTDPRVNIPQGRGWVILAVTFITMILMYGVWYGYSVFLLTLLHEFGWSRSLVSGAFSTFVMVHGLLGPVIGWLLRRFGPRRLIMAGAVLMGFAMFLMAETTQWWHLYVAFGLIAAFAMSLAGWIPAVVLVGGWFFLAWYEYGYALIDKMIFRELVGHAVESGAEKMSRWQSVIYPSTKLFARYAPWILITLIGIWRVFRHPAAAPEERR
ncbi:MAG: MFS transporter, partial [candidate division NC10 bacterium]